MGLGWDSKGIMLDYVGLSAFRVALYGIKVGLVRDCGVTVGLEWDYGGDVGLFGIRMGELADVRIISMQCQKGRTDTKEC